MALSTERCHEGHCPTRQSGGSVGNGARVQNTAPAGHRDKEKGNADRHVIGVIADTHGAIRREALETFRGTELIIHAGDIGSAQVLESLQAIAPVIAVRGNVDEGEWARDFPKVEVVEVGQRVLCVIHDLSELDFDPDAAAFSAVIHGHSHRPSIQSQKGVLFLNPGSAGPRRFNLPVAIALIHVKDGVLEPQLIELTVANSFSRGKH